MRRSLAVTLLLTSSAAAQLPPTTGPTPPRPLPPGMTMPPRQLPPGVLDLTREADKTTAAGDATVKLPRAETLGSIDSASVRVRQAGGSWQLTASGRAMADFGPNPDDSRNAEEAARVLRELRPTQWASVGTVGSGRPVVGYGLFNGKARLCWPQPKAVSAIDLTTVRAERVRGVWVVKDDSALHLNFGPAQGDAEMATAVTRRYGFNRLGHVGTPGARPDFSYLFAAPDDAGLPGGAGLGALAVADAEQGLTRTGVPVPGLGYVGEMVKFDPRKLEVRRDGTGYVLASGPDVFATFGYAEHAARDALRLVQECHFTDYCRVGGLTFFLIDGQPPTRVPYNARGRNFDPKGVRVLPATDGTAAVAESTGRQLLKAATAAEAEQVAGVIRAFGFDTLCQSGPSPAASLHFLAKSGRR
jgi:hypothetical protein